MTIIAGMLAVALVAVVYLMLRHWTRQEEAWTAERRELLTRIQHPELVPVQAAPAFQAPEPEPDEFDQVGQINLEEG